MPNNNFLQYIDSYILDAVTFYAPSEIAMSNYVIWFNVDVITFSFVSSFVFDAGLANLS